MILFDLLCQAFDANTPARSGNSVILSVQDGGFVRLTPRPGGFIALEVNTPDEQWSETADGLYDAVVFLQLAGVAPKTGSGWAPAFIAIEGSVVELKRRGYDVTATHAVTSSAIARRDGAVIEILVDDVGHVMARCGETVECGADALDAVMRIEERLTEQA